MGQSSKSRVVFYTDTNTHSSHALSFTPSRLLRMARFNSLFKQRRSKVSLAADGAARVLARTSYSSPRQVFPLAAQCPWGKAHADTSYFVTTKTTKTTSRIKNKQTATARI